MLDDMRDGAEFVQKNYDVGDKVYTLGGSYGGYSSAQNVVRHNDYYDCSVIIAGFFEFDELTSTWDGREEHLLVTIPIQQWVPNLLLLELCHRSIIWTK